MNNMSHLRGALPPGLRPGAAPTAPQPPGLGAPPGIFAGRPRSGPGAPPPGVNVSREQLAAQAQYRQQAAPPSVLPGRTAAAGAAGSLLSQYAAPTGSYAQPPPMPKFVSAPPPKPSFAKKPPAGFGAPPKAIFHGAAPPPPDEFRSQPRRPAQPAPPPRAPKAKPASWAAATGAVPPPPPARFQTQQVAAPLAVEAGDAVTSVFCSNLNYDIDDDTIRDHFKDVGEVRRIKWLEDRETGQFRGMGVIEFQDHATALKAVARNESECMGRTFYCQLHKPKPKVITVGRAMAAARASNRPVYDGEDPIAASLALEAEILRDMPDVKERVERRGRAPSFGSPARTRGAALPRFEPTSCMSGSDIAYVIRSHMRPLETMDSYTDDYYCHKWNQRRLVGGVTGDAGSSLVPPVWSETKEHAQARAAHMAADLKNVTQKWEEGNKVLGHVQKTNVARPRALLSVGDATGTRDGEAPFTSPMWLARRACDAGSQALLELLEVRALGHATPPGSERFAEVFGACREKLESVARAIAHCEAHPLDLGDANVMFLLGAGPPPDVEPNEPVDHSTKTAAVFSALMALPKGVKLLARWARVMPVTAAASPLLRAVLETPRAMNDLYFVDHDEALHAALRVDAFAARVPFKTLVALVDGLLAVPSLYELVQAGDDLAARADAEPKLAEEWKCLRE